MAITKNAVGVLQNPFQGDYHKVLCVCTAGCLRSPTAAVVLAEAPYNFNTRSAGLYDEIAIVPVTEALLAWADEIVCMENHHAHELMGMLQALQLDKPVRVLGIPDNFAYRDPELVELIKTRYDRIDPLGN